MTELNRRDVLRTGALATALGAATFAYPAAAVADGDRHRGRHHGHHGDEDADVLAIHHLESTFHEARSKQDIGLLMSLWSRRPVFNSAIGVLTDPDQVRAFFLGSPSFTAGPLMAFSPTFKSQTAVHGGFADIYFECHDVDLATGAMVSHLFLAGTVRKSHRGWLFWHMTGGSAPLSVDEIYFP